MPRQTAIASVSGLIAGVTITALLTGDFAGQPLGDLVLPVLARLAPLVCVSLVTMKILHHWLRDHTSVTRAELAAASEQREAFRRETDRRLADIARREDLLERATMATELRVATVHRALEDERGKNQRLQAEYTTLMNEYNDVVQSTLQQAADLFRPRPAAEPTASSEPARDATVVPIAAPGRPVHDRAVNHPAHGATPPYP